MKILDLLNLLDEGEEIIIDIDDYNLNESYKHTTTPDSISYKYATKNIKRIYIENNKFNFEIE